MSNILPHEATILLPRETETILTIRGKGLTREKDLAATQIADGVIPSSLVEKYEGPAPL
jgi:hypothetical protein